MENNCPHCGASMKRWWHTLTPVLVECLIDIRAKVVEKNENKVHLQKDLFLTKNEYNNFQKLRYHALVAKYKENGVHVPGYWLVTKRGADFLNGVIKVPMKVASYRNRVVAKSEDLVSITDIISGDTQVERVFDISFDEPADEDITKAVTVNKKNKKKGYSYCPQCDNVLRLKLVFSDPDEHGVVKIEKKLMVCSSCKYEITA